MNIQLVEIIKMLDSFAPSEFAEIWDNVGLMVGCPEQKISKILVCLDVSNKVVDEAIKGNYDLIISHHPFIFAPMKNIICNDNKSRLIYSLIKNNIAVLSIHTNLDSIRGGVNDVLSNQIDLVDVRPFDNNLFEDFSKNEEEISEDAVFYGLATIGRLRQKLDLYDFACNVKERLKLPNVKFIGQNTKKIEKVAVFCGSFCGSVEDVLLSGVDAIVTGELKHSFAVEFDNIGIGVLELGHFNSECCILPEIMKVISNAFPAIEVNISNEGKEPYSYIV